MKILLTGKNGQVGFALNKKLTSLDHVIATDRETLDLRNPDTIQVFVDKIKPDMIINTAAYAQVDQAEREPELAYKTNTVAPKILAEKAFELEPKREETLIVLSGIYYSLNEFDKSKAYQQMLDDLRKQK